MTYSHRILQMDDIFSSTDEDEDYSLLGMNGSKPDIKVAKELNSNKVEKDTIAVGNRKEYEQQNEENSSHQPRERVATPNFEAVKRKHMLSTPKKQERNISFQTPKPSTLYKGNSLKVANSKMKICYGFIPDHIVETLENDTNWKIRMTAMSHLERLVKEIDDLEAIQPHFRELLDFVFSLIDDPSFKISLSGFVVLGELIGKFGEKFSPFVNSKIIPKIVQKWGDTKLVIQHASSAVMAKVVTHIVRPHVVVHLLISDMLQSNWQVKEEMINFVIYCLLKYPNFPYEYRDIVHGLTSSLRDVRLRVKFVSVEAIAVVHANIQEKILPMLEFVQQSDAKTYKMLCTRFKQPSLPLFAKTKGVIEHKLLLKLQSPQVSQSRRVQSAHMKALGNANKNNSLKHIREKSRARAHSAPRRIQSDDQYVSYNPEKRSLDGSENTESEEEDEYVQNSYNATNGSNRYSEKEVDVSESSTVSGTALPALIHKKRIPEVLKNPKSTPEKVKLWLNADKTEPEKNDSVTPILKKRRKEVSPDITSIVEKSGGKRKPLRVVQVSPNKQHIPGIDSHTQSESVERKSLIGKGSLDHVETQDLRPCSNPEEDLEHSRSTLKSGNWKEKFEAITIVRQLTVYHSNLIRENLHDICELIIQEIGNLRSAVSKNSLVCAEDMFSCLGRLMDSELAKFVPLLLKKTSEANRFINGKAEQALRAMVQNCSQEKSLTLILQQSNSKNPAIRATTSSLVYDCVDKMQLRVLKFKYLQKLFNCIVLFLNDGGHNARSNGRKIAYCLYQVFDKNGKSSSFDRFCSAHISQAKDLEKFKASIEQCQDIELFGVNGRKQVMNGTHSKLSAISKPTRSRLYKKPKTKVKTPTSVKSRPAWSRQNSIRSPSKPKFSL